MKQPILCIVIALLPSLAIATEPWFGIPTILDADEADQTAPVVSFNSIRQEYLIAWTAVTAGSHEIVGIRADADGVPVGSPFTISATTNSVFSPDIAYDPFGDRYLVVWTFDYSGNHTDYDIHGRFIPWDGPSPSEPAFVIDQPTSMQGSPSVAYSPVSFEFMVVWHNEEAGVPAWITAKRLPADGSPGSSTFTVVSASEDRYYPELAWNPQIGQYLVVYERVGAGPQWDVYGTRLSWAGGVIGAEIGIAGWPSAEEEAVVASCRGSYLVVWSTGSDSTAEIYSRAVSAEGSVGPIVANLSGATGYQDRPSVACSESGAQFLAVWQRFDTDITVRSHGIAGAFIELDGTAAASFTVFERLNELGDMHPGIAFGNHGKALVAWDSQRPDLTSTDIVGRLVGDRVFADGFEIGDPRYWQVGSTPR